MQLYGKRCSTTGCDFPFTMTSKPHKEQTAICPQCGAENSLADAKAIPNTEAAPASKEAK